ANDFSCGRERLICAVLAAFGFRSLPAEQRAVKSERLFAMGGEQFVPANPARRIRRGGRRSGVQPLEQAEPCGLRGGEDRKAADVADIRRPTVHAAAEALHPCGGCVHVVDRDMAEPARPHPGFPCVRRKNHEPSDRGISVGEQYVRPARRGGVPYAPTHHLGVEGFGGRKVCRRQLVPGETTVRTDHAYVSVRAWQILNYRRSAASASFTEFSLCESLQDQLAWFRCGASAPGAAWRAV